MSAPSTPDGVLKPTLSVFDVVAITVSAVTPASSVFVIAPFAIQQAGSGYNYYVELEKVSGIDGVEQALRVRTGEGDRIFHAGELSVRPR